MPKRSAAGKQAEDKQQEEQSFPDELAINSDTSDDSEDLYNESDEDDEEGEVETGLAGVSLLAASLWMFEHVSSRLPRSGAPKRSSVLPYFIICRSRCFDSYHKGPAARRGRWRTVGRASWRRFSSCHSASGARRARRPRC